MKLSSYMIFATCLALTLSACGKKSSSKHAVNQADAAISEDEVAAACAVMSESMALHGAMEGYTASESGKFHVKVDWSSPLVSGELSNTAKVTFLNHHGEPIALTLSSFKLFMPSMGHGSIKNDKLVLARDAAHINVWDVSQIYFSMGGAANEWVADVEGSVCGISDKARVSIPVEVQ